MIPQITGIYSRICLWNHFHFINSAQSRCNGTSVRLSAAWVKVYKNLQKTDPKTMSDPKLQGNHKP
jgi:hypothetical protein